MIDKGRSYKKLNPSYVIFICQFDLFHMGRHIYTCESICREDKNISLGDGVVKIFLNADGKMNDVSRELKAFLDYVAGKKSEDAFVNKLEETVKAAKKNREWRREYMTLLMRDQENIEKGIEKGIRGMVSALKELNIPDATIMQKIREKFDLSGEEAERYIR